LVKVCGQQQADPGGANRMMLSHEPWLVVLSMCVAFQGSYVGLSLARRIRSAEGTLQRVLITGSALTLALGIWTMHFVGMLAAQLPVNVDFLVLPTLLSFLVCVLVVGFAVFFVASIPASRLRTVIAALLMGGGIVAMHYIGMLALHASVAMRHDPMWVATSVAIGIGASGFALWYGFRDGEPRSLFISALIMGLAISAMHYTAMVGVAFQVQSSGAGGMPALSPGLLAIVVSIVAFLVSGLFLLTLMPDRVGTAEPQALTGQPAAHHGEDGGSEFDDVQTRRAASDAVEPSALAAPGEPRPSEPTAAPIPVPRTLPVERDGRRMHMEIGRLVAVQAQAHYTNLFDGETTWFCPLPISEVEALLDANVFARVHRSHIINLDRVSSVRKSGESEVVTMAGKGVYQAPVSRTRRSWLHERLGQQLRHDKLTT
jgi:diguanylate cyclase